MSYVVGIKRRRSVYLAADSAVTLSPGVPERLQSTQARTSFGEAHLREPLRIVQETGLKIHNLRQLAIGVAGSVANADRFVRQVSARLQLRAEAQVAIHDAIDALTSDERASFQFVAAIPRSPDAQLISFNVAGTTELLEHAHADVVQIGCPSEIHMELLKTMAQSFNEHLPLEDPHIYLAAILGWLQSLGVRQYMLEQGIGGAFCGLVVGESVEWQSDLVYCLHSGVEPKTHAIFSLIRDNVHVLHSTFEDSTRALIASASCALHPRQWLDRWWRGAAPFSMLVGVKPGFVILIDQIDWKLIVIEMPRSGDSPFVTFGAPELMSAGTRLEWPIAFHQPIPKLMALTAKSGHAGDELPLLFAWLPVDGNFKIVEGMLAPSQTQ